MDFCINATELRKALSDIEKSEQNGFMHCLAVLRLTSAGPNLEQCVAEYSDIIERAHPTDPSLNWGRFQGVSRRYRFDDGELIDLSTRVRSKP